MDSKTTVKRLWYQDGTITICPVGRRRGQISEIEKAERRLKMQELSKIKKTFSLSSKEKRIINCSGVRLWHKKQYSLKWFTLTFTTDIDEKNANICLSKFTENLKTNYNAKNYIIVKEHTKRGRPHYHCIVEMPFKHFAVLNRAWCSAISDFCPFSNNALTSGREKIIKNLSGVMKYCLKYIQKANDAPQDTRVYFISRDILPQPKELTYNEYIYFITSFKSKTIIRDNFTVVFLERFFYLPEMFDMNFKKKDKKPEKIPIKPDAIPINLDF